MKRRQTWRARLKQARKVRSVFDVPWPCVRLCVCVCGLTEVNSKRVRRQRQRQVRGEAVF